VVRLWDPPEKREYWSMEGTGGGRSTKADSSTMAKLFIPHIVFIDRLSSRATTSAATR